MPDRRTSHRFPLHLPVRYRAVESATPSGWTVSESVNISSGGLFFTTSETMLPGQRLEAAISWPVFLDNQITLKLTVKGMVVRTGVDGAAMRFQAYEFKTSQIGATRRTDASRDLQTNLPIAN